MTRFTTVLVAIVLLTMAIPAEAQRQAVRRTSQPRQQVAVSAPCVPDRLHPLGCVLASNRQLVNTLGRDYYGYGNNYYPYSNYGYDRYYRRGSVVRDLSILGAVLGTVYIANKVIDGRRGQTDDGEPDCREQGLLEIKNSGNQPIVVVDGQEQSFALAKGPACVPPGMYRAYTTEWVQGPDGNVSTQDYWLRPDVKNDRLTFNASKKIGR